MKIVVLAGGCSTEREVSIVSGLNVCKALRRRGHRAVLADVFFEADVSGELFPEEYDVDAKAAQISARNGEVEETKKNRREFFGENVLTLCRAADMVFLALHGENGENGKVQAAFDLLGIRYTGTGYLSSALAMDKGLTKTLFEAGGVPTPRGTVHTKAQGICTPKDLGMELPLVVKTCCGGSSVGVYIANTEEEFTSALEQAFAYEEEAVIEEYIKGREFSVAVVDGKAYPVIEIAPLHGFYDYKNKYQPGATVETCPAELSEELTQKMQHYAELGAKVLFMEGYCRLDFMMREDGSMYCLEANTLPGMTPTSLIPQEAKVLGMDYPELCEKLIEVSMKKYEK